MRSMMEMMNWVTRHVVGVAIIGVALASVSAVFAFARPTNHPNVMPTAPKDLPYTNVTYNVADARRAFATANVPLISHVLKSQPMANLATKDLVVVVDVFGEPQKVKDSGYSRYYTFVNGHWVQAPRVCSAGAANAERWRGNVRVIVSCARAAGTAGTWLRRVDLALGRL
jgi:hypothetical protein